MLGNKATLLSSFQIRTHELVFGVRIKDTFVLRRLIESNSVVLELRHYSDLLTASIRKSQRRQRTQPKEALVGLVLAQGRYQEMHP